MPTYALTMVAAGIGIPVLAAMNAALGREIASPAVAATALFAIAFLTALATAVTLGIGPAKLLPHAPKHLFFGGILIAFYLLSITFIAPHFGVGNAVFFVLLGQLVSAAVIDHFALFGAIQNPLNLTRASGIALMAAGVFLTQRA